MSELIRTLRQAFRQLAESRTPACKHESGVLLTQLRPEDSPVVLCLRCGHNFGRPKLARGISLMASMPGSWPPPYFTET